MYEVVCELVKIVKDVDGQLLTKTHKRCVEEIDPAFWGLYLRHGFDSPASIPIYHRLAPLHSKTYNPLTSHLIKANPTSTAFPFLIMYSIRHRTLTDHPDSFDDLFPRFEDSEKISGDIGKPKIPSPSPLQLIKTLRGPIPIESTYSNSVPHPCHLGPNAR